MVYRLSRITEKEKTLGFIESPKEIMAAFDDKFDDKEAKRSVIFSLIFSL